MGLSLLKEPAVTNAAIRSAASLRGEGTRMGVAMWDAR